MNQPRNINRTGKVTISRKSKNSMRKDMSLSVYRWALFVLPLGVLIWLVNPAINSLQDWCIAMVSALFTLVVFWIGGIFVNRGSMVESICFDYDNQMLKLQRTDLRNSHRRIVIPFEGLSVGIYRPGGTLQPRAHIYSHNKKIALLVFSFGWDDSAYDNVKYQLETYLAEKLR